MCAPKIKVGEILQESFSSKKYICIKNDNYNIHTRELVYHIHEIARSQKKDWNTESFTLDNGEVIFYESFNNIKGTYDEVIEILNTDFNKEH